MMIRHFLASVIILLSTGAVARAAFPAIVGTWQIGDGAADGSAVLVFLSNGVYFHIQDGENDPAGPDGFERGTYTWNATTGALAVNIDVDTNGEIGLSNPETSFTVSVAGDTLTINDGAGNFASERVFSATSAIVGGWQFGDGVSDESGILIFLSNGRYLFAEDGQNRPEGPDGMERGTYAWDENSGVFSAIVQLDTNGDIGFSNPAGGFNFKISGDLGTFGDQEVTVTVKRVVNSPGTVGIQTSGGNLSIAFEGTLRESNDLINWTDVDPQPGSSPLITTPIGGKRFFISRGR